MLDHFFGSCVIDSIVTKSSKEFNFDNLNASHRFTKFVSMDQHLVLYSSKIWHNKNNKDSISAKSNRVLALAGCLNFDDEKYHNKNITDELENIIINDIKLPSELNSANGTFAILSYHENGNLLLAADALGARPLYFAQYMGVLYFSTSFTIIKKIYPKPLELDIQAYAESIAFGYPLGSRTLSTDISVLRDGEFLFTVDGKYQLNHYHDWRQIVLSDRNRAKELSVCVDAFNEAVRSRLTKQSGPQYALLSGGLDSRMIVARLREENQVVIASNFSSTGTLDEQYCKDFAEASGVDVLHVPWEPDLTSTCAGSTTTTMLKRALSSLPMKPVFSGDGGGEVFGLMMLPKMLLRILNTKGLKDAIAHCSSHERVSTQVVTKKFSKELDRLAFEGMSSEFDRMGGIHPEKAMQIFFLVNDLRCHLHDYFDNTDMEARELLLPFYDRRVLKSVLQISPPFDEYIGHQFYYDLLPRVSLLNISVAWQSYQSSLPCPIQKKRDGMTQWDHSKHINKLYSGRWRRKAIISIFTSGRIEYVRYVNIIFLSILNIFLYKNYSYIYKQYIALKNAHDKICGS